MGIIAESAPTYAALPPFPDDIKTAPLITLSLSKLAANDKDEIARFYECSKNLGFFYLELSGIDEGERLFNNAQELLHLEQKFFDLPLEEKKIADRDVMPPEESYYGYKRMGTTMIDKNGLRDRHENYNLKKDDILGLMPSLPAPQFIKDSMPLFKSYALTAEGIIDLLLGHLNDCLELPPKTLQNLHRITERSGNHIRFITAPPHLEGAPAQSAAAHTDFGSLTILFNWLGGLQVRLPGGEEWVYVRPVPGCAIVNLGDALVKFSGGLLRSNIHRVLTPPGAQAKETRYSLVYFSRPEDAVILKRLSSPIIDKQPKSDKPEEEQTSKDWILRRGLSTKVKDDWKPEDWEKTRGTEGNRE